MRCIRAIAWLIAFALAPLAGFPPGAHAASPPGFWVWHRRDALRSEEREAVKRAGATLFWHVGELAVSNAGARWRWREDAPPEAGAIPVVRIDLSGTNPLNRPEVADEVVQLANRAGQLQIDCDCPDRLLDSYATFLADLHRRVPHLSVTALAGWSRRPAFPALQAAVEWIAVMFYDLQPDPVRIGPGAPPLPLVDPATFARQLAAWDACRIPWRAGLPNFSRVSVYNPAGGCLGHIRNWSWDELTFQPRLKFESAPAPGVVTLRVAGDFVLGESTVKSGRCIALRWPELNALASAVDAVGRSRATGFVWFRLPDSSDASGWSVAQLANLGARPVLRVKAVESATGVPPGTEGSRERRDACISGSLRLAAPSKETDTCSGCVVLSNDALADLPNRIAGDGPADRGYALELDAADPVWREALPGDFWRAGAHADPEGKPVAVAVPFATRLTFWFSQLRAGESLKTGLIQLAPGASFRQIRYRILPRENTWKTFD